MFPGLVFRVIGNIFSFIVAATRDDDVIVLIGNTICHFVIVFSFSVELIANLHIGEILAQDTFIIEIFVFFYKAFGFEDGHANEIVSIVRFKGQCGYFFPFLVIIRHKVIGVPGRVFHLYKANDVFREGIVIFDNAFLSQGLGVIWF